MKMGAWSPLAFDKVRYVGDAVVIVVADTKGQARDAAEAVEIAYKELPSVTDASKAMDAGAAADPSGGGKQSDLRLGHRQCRRDRRGVHRRPRMSSSSTSSTTGWCRTRWSRAPHSAIYDKAEDHYTCWTTSQNPHLARLVMSAFYNVAPENKLRVIAPDVGGGFGSKIYIYPEEIVCLWASKKTGVPVKWVADRTESFLTDAHGRDHHTHAEMAFDEDHKITGFKVDTQANLGAYMSLFSSVTPTYLCATLLSGQYDIPAIHANVKAIYTNTAPVDAYRGAGRPETTYRRRAHDGGRGAGSSASSPVELRRKNFIREFPHQTPVILMLRRRRLRGFARRRAEGFRLCRLRRAQGGGQEGRQAARHRPLLLHRGLRHRAVGGGRLARRGRRPLGIRRGARQRGRHDRGADRLAQPRAGPRDDLRAARQFALRRADRTRCRSCMATPTRCRWAWAPTARARARSACRPSPRRSTRSRPRRRRSPRTCWKPTRATSSSRTAR